MKETSNWLVVFHQPIWKKYARQIWVHLPPKFRGEHIKNLWNRHHLVVGEISTDPKRPPMCSTYIFIQVFPKMVVPPNHRTGFSIINHPFWGTPIFGDTHTFKPNVGPGLKNHHGKIMFFSPILMIFQPLGFSNGVYINPPIVVNGGWNPRVGKYLTPM